MGNGLLAFLVAISAAAWIYNKMMRSTGGNTQSVLIVAGVSGFIIFLFMLVLANALL